MAIFTSAQETINVLEAIFERHKEERICVVGTTCCGKSTLLNQIPIEQNRCAMACQGCGAVFMFLKIGSDRIDPR